MKCPACSESMTEKTVAEIDVDVCEKGCGGIWFDAFELQHVDEPHETSGEELLDLPVQISGEKAPYDETYSCPRCNDRDLERLYYSSRKLIEVDECYECGGIFLDPGELRTIRQSFQTKEERKKEGKKFVREEFGEALNARLHKEKEKRDRIRKVTRIFRWLLPSYWIPGDQEWGAY